MARFIHQPSNPARITMLIAVGLAVGARLAISPVAEDRALRTVDEPRLIASVEALPVRAQRPPVPRPTLPRFDDVQGERTGQRLFVDPGTLMLLRGTIGPALDGDSPG